ncbi:hypothetical protein, partial [Streptosporangium sp. NPDC003464]
MTSVIVPRRRRGDDTAVLVEYEDLEAAARHRARVAEVHRFPLEGDDVAQAHGVAPAPEGELPRRDGLLVAACSPGLDRVVPVRFEGGGLEAQVVGGLPDILRRVEYMLAALGPQLLDCLAAQLGVRFETERDVAVGQVLGTGTDIGHRFSSCRCSSRSSG